MIKVHKKIVISLLAFIFIGLIFYWYQLRPASIRKKCFGVVSETKNLSVINGNVLYELCLAKHGLEK